MTAIFLIAAGSLALLTLGFVLRPLWRGNRRIGAGLIGSIAIVAGLTYWLVGTPAALDSTQLRAPETLADAVAQLQAELRRNPNQVEGWRLLARAQAEQGQLEQARDALANALKHAPDDPDVLVEAAQARAMAAQGRLFDTTAIGYLRHALERQPSHQRARWFLGIALRQAGQPAEAAQMWEPLLASVAGDTAQTLLVQINAARADAGLKPLSTPTERATSPALLKVSVDIAPALAAKLPPNAVLYVLARKRNGPPMPVAVKRLVGAKFPVAVELGDGDSPMPTMKLSQAGEVELIARLSQSGAANRATGDFESEALAARAPADARYSLQIDHVVE